MASDTLKLAQRMSRLGTETAFDVLVKARAVEATGKSVIHLEIGEPDFDTPHHITQAAMDALEKGATHYTPAAGHPGVARGHCQALGRDARNSISVPAKLS